VIYPEVQVFGGSNLSWRGSGKRSPHDPSLDLALFSSELSKPSERLSTQSESPSTIRDLEVMIPTPLQTSRNDSTHRKLLGNPNRLGFPNKPKSNKISMNSRRIQLLVGESVDLGLLF
jgi:hypothetical protein